MCVVSKPEIPAPTAAEKEKKKLPILRNPILDGMLGDVAALRAGTQAFRIDLLNPLMIPVGGVGGAASGGFAIPVPSGGTTSTTTTSTSTTSGGTSSGGGTNDVRTRTDIN